MAADDLREGEYGGSTGLDTTGTIDSLSRQPDIFDFAQTNQFKVYLPIFPTTEWFVVGLNIPDISIGRATQATPFTEIAHVGDKPQYGDFSMTFMVDEQYKNYIEMHNWLKNIAFPFSRSQFNKLPRPDFVDREGDRDLFTDILVTILSSKNNPVVNLHIYEAFPVSLSAIDYSQQQSDTDYATCEVSFAYTWFDIENVPNPYK